MNRLAILGGAPVRDTKTNPWPKWPVWDKNEEKALIETLNLGLRLQQVILHLTNAPYMRH
jgi:L-glutamine:2-deoxy-scyllo-inosose/3-amino-2,3-dideoxy-scyllo-inosose aminotransferase